MPKKKKRPWKDNSYDIAELILTRFWLSSQITELDKLSSGFKFKRAQIEERIRNLRAEEKP